MAVEAELAAALIFVESSFVVRSRWLGRDAEIEILVGKECLLETDLLNPHRLEIDFRTRNGSLNLERRRSGLLQTQESCWPTTAAHSWRAEADEMFVRH